MTLRVFLVSVGCAMGVFTGMLLSTATCGPKDPLAKVKTDYPGGWEYLTWETPSPPRETYLLIRWKPDNLAGTQRAVLLVKQQSDWEQIAESELGFLTLQELSNVIARPLDESAVRAFRLR